MFSDPELKSVIKKMKLINKNRNKENLEWTSKATYKNSLIILVQTKISLIVSWVI